ncbi:MAG: histidine--tRNA ligase family protein [Verrucomicrobiota bacterium]|nr:histidine--tRNA ligase family protein [Verrucomicrobiota bacterium]
MASNTISSSLTRPNTATETEFGDTVVFERGSRPDYSITDRLGRPTGFTDYTPQQMRVVTLWLENLKKVFEQNGFTAMQPRPVEYGTNLQLTGGLEKQIFGISGLQDGHLTKLGLPFDRTIQLAILIAKYHMQMTFPYCRYDIGWSWRGEKATAGRYRAFIQADIDIIDTKLTARADAQCVVTMIKGLQSCGVAKCNVLVNHIGVAKAFMKNAGITEEKFKDGLRAIDKLKPDNEEEVVAELIQNVPELSSDKARELLKNMSYRGPISQFQFPFPETSEARQALDHLKEVEETAILLGVSPRQMQFAPNLTRGLDYYTGVVLETFIEGRERLGSVASGGRYDNLVGAFNEKAKYQGVGFSIGMTRLFDVMQAENLVDLSRQTTAQVYVGYRTRNEFKKAIEVANALRDQLGIKVELQMTDMKIGKQLEFCDSKGIPYSIIVFNNDEICLKNMGVKKTSEEQTKQETFNEVNPLVSYMKSLKAHGKLDEERIPAPKETSDSKVDQ